MPTVIHSVNPYLEPTTVWIHDQIRSLKRYRPIVYARAVRNLDRFPVDAIVDFDDRPPIARLVDRIATRLRGTYPGYGRRARADGADLIHAHFGQEGFRCLAAKREAGVPLVTTFYGLDVSALPRIPTWKRRFARLFEAGDLFLAEGPHMGATLTAIGCPAEKVRIQRLGIDRKKIPFAGRDGRGTPSEVLMYASLREKKGHRHGIEAFAAVAAERPEAKLTIVGDGPLRGALERQVEAAGITGRVTFLGNLPHGDALELLTRAHVLVYPSVTAADGDTEGGAPVGILEAMAAGLPVVTTRHADIPYVLGDGEGGTLVDERDTAGLADGIRRVFEGDDGVEAEREAAKRLVETRHDLAAQGASLEATYDEARGLK